MVDYGGPGGPVGERVAVSLSNVARGPLTKTFRVEYLSHDLQSETIDRARTQGMNFELPVLPVCKTDAGTVPAGGETTVIASGLLPIREHHVFLGDQEVAKIHSDAEGDATVTFTVPIGVRPGKHLITIGALAVTGDCLTLSYRITIVSRSSGIGVLIDK